MTDLFDEKEGVSLFEKPLLGKAVDHPVSVARATPDTYVWEQGASVERCNGRAEYVRKYRT
jgi:hypothetical protein